MPSCDTWGRLKLSRRQVRGRRHHGGASRCKGRRCTLRWERHGLNLHQGLSISPGQRLRLLGEELGSLLREGSEDRRTADGAAAQRRSTRFQPNRRKHQPNHHRRDDHADPTHVHVHGNASPLSQPAAVSTRTRIPATTDWPALAFAVETSNPRRVVAGGARRWCLDPLPYGSSRGSRVCSGES